MDKFIENMELLFRTTEKNTKYPFQRELINLHSAIPRIYKLSKLTKFNKLITVKDIHDTSYHKLALYTDSPKLLDFFGRTLIKFQSCNNPSNLNLWKIVYKTYIFEPYISVTMFSSYHESSFRLGLTFKNKYGDILDYEWRHLNDESLSYCLLKKGSNNIILEYYPGESVDTLTQYTCITSNDFNVFLLALGYYIRKVSYNQTIKQIVMDYVVYQSLQL